MALVLAMSLGRSVGLTLPDWTHINKGGISHKYWSTIEKTSTDSEAREFWPTQARPGKRKYSLLPSMARNFLKLFINGVMCKKCN